MKKLLKIFLVMFRIGLFTFGGGLVMLPQMSREFSDKYHWLEPDEITDFFAVAQSLPGVVAVNASVLTGYRLAGAAGAAVAALGAILPSLIVIMVFTVFYQRLLTNEYLLGAMRGISAAVIALLFNTTLKLGKDSLSSALSWVLFAAAAVICLLTDISVIYVILGGAAAGLINMLVRRRLS
jgi:chromate transporter